MTAKITFGQLFLVFLGLLVISAVVLILRGYRLC